MGLLGSRFLPANGGKNHSASAGVRASAATSAD
jgi:hypothetical protein